MSAQLLFRVDPVAGESPRGYLCRTAHEHGYRGPNALAEIAGLWVSGKLAGLDQEAAISPLAHALRLEPAEWRSMCYQHVKGRNRFKQRSFYGETISAYDLNYASSEESVGHWWVQTRRGAKVAYRSQVSSHPDVSRQEHDRP